MYTVEHVKSKRLTEWRELFAQAAKSCSQKVKDYPKGKKLIAYRECMRSTLKELHDKHLKGRT